MKHTKERNLLMKNKEKFDQLRFQRLLNASDFKEDFEQIFGKRQWEDREVPSLKVHPRTAIPRPHIRQSRILLQPFSGARTRLTGRASLNQI